jgi:hypothetical protein
MYLINSGEQMHFNYYDYIIQYADFDAVSFLLV